MNENTSGLEITGNEAAEANAIRDAARQEIVLPVVSQEGVEDTDSAPVE